MLPVSAVAFTVVLLFVSAVPLCAAKCAFTVQVGLAIDSKLSMKIAKVSLLKDCLLFLERHADTYAAVAYNEVSLDCCTVPAKESYKLVESAGWSTYYIEKQQTQTRSIEGSVFFTQSGEWTVPAGVSVLKVLAVGGGGGGSCDDGGGAGSGFVNYLTLTVEPFRKFTITIGAGGSAGRNGGPSVFGNNLLTAAGGHSFACDCEGASGGSGGGPACAHGNLSGSGGSGGSSGTSGASLDPVGAGQGSSFTSHFSEFKLNTLSAGAGAVGIAGNSDYLFPGGGGGGGVLINGAGPNATGTCIIDGVMCEPVPASGYGAGGSGGSYASNNDVWINYEGGAGASGLVYIEYY